MSSATPCSARLPGRRCMPTCGSLWRSSSRTLVAAHPCCHRGYERGGGAATAGRGCSRWCATQAQSARAWRACRAVCSLTSGPQRHALLDPLLRSLYTKITECGQGGRLEPECEHGGVTGSGGGGICSSCAGRAVAPADSRPSCEDGSHVETGMCCVWLEEAALKRACSGAGRQARWRCGPRV